MDLTSIRAQIPALRDTLYLNTGTFGPLPTIVIDEVRQAFDLVEQRGPYAPDVREWLEHERYEWTRSAAAGMLGAEPDEIILTSSASEGTNTIAYGLDWRPGDEVVIGDEEHQSGTLPWLTLSQRSGIRVRVARIDPDPAVLLQNFSDQISDRTRLLFFSHVSCVSGIRLPVRQLCRLAHDKGALAVIDGAHALGQFPVNAREIGCDAYIGCGHKWLLGPQGTGLTFIPREHLDTFRPSWIGWGAQVEYSLDLSSQSFLLQDSARRFEFGTRPWPLFAGLGRALNFVNDIGLKAIEARVRPLARCLKDSVDKIDGWQRLTPLDPERSAGIVSFKLGDMAADDVKELLWKERRLLVSYWPPTGLIRLSVAFFTTQEEIDLALASIRKVTKG